MATVQKINFEPLTDILPVHRRDFQVADPTLVTPSNPAVIVDGEWMTLNASYQLVRATDYATVDNTASLRSFPVWSERGRYDSQVLRKLVVLFLGVYECDTRIFDAAATSGSGAAITAVMQGLKVATIQPGGGAARKFSGLVGHGGEGTDTDPVVGYVTRLPGSNGGKLRFIQGW